MNRTWLKRLLYNFSSSSFSTCSNDSNNLIDVFNSKPDNRKYFEYRQESVGLFNVPQLLTHNGFYYLNHQCRLETERLVKEAVSDERTRKIVEVFDALSDTLCKVADLAEFIRVAHPLMNYVNAAETASASISGIVEQLNTNRPLYLSLLNVVEKGDKIYTNEIDNHTSRLFLFDFEQSGIHLPELDRRKVVNLNDLILCLGQQFVAGCTVPRYIKRDLLPPGLQNQFTLDQDNVVITGLYNESSNPLVRELAYRIYLSPDKQQYDLLSQLLQARHELAKICGFPTYAHRALRGSTLETPENVMEFLNSLTEGLKLRASMDFYRMNKMKVYDGFGPLKKWDTAYYTKKAKKELFDVQYREYSPYFSLGSCMEGLNMLFKRLFGVSLVAEKVSPGECWVLEVYKLAVMHETEGLLGYIYCDFFQRMCKQNQDCHFTIRGGKKLEDGTYQLPIVVLMLNFPHPRWNGPTLLSPSMIDNLFHEMGHAMHSMLARTHYQHVTGTRCSTDFAEVPSVLMEYFARDVRVLKTFARHFQTNECMPDDMLERLCASKQLFMASEMQLQVFYAVVDQLYHGEYPLEATTTETLAKTQAEYYNLKYVDKTAWQLRFSHLVGYGAKYYSYLVSRALASCIWQNYFQHDPLNRMQGERYRRECLSYGGSKPPRKIVRDFLNKEPTTDLLVTSILREIDASQHQIR